MRASTHAHANTHTHTHTQGLVRSCVDLVATAPTDALTKTCTSSSSPELPECKVAFCNKMIASEKEYQEAASKIKAHILKRKVLSLFRKSPLYKKLKSSLYKKLNKKNRQ